MKKEIGWVLLIIGLCFGGYSLGLDTSVSYTHKNLETGKEEVSRVSNLGLMDQRRNFIIISGFICLIGTVLIVTASKKSIEMKPLNKREIIGEDLVKVESLINKTDEENSIPDTKEKESSTLSNSGKILLLGLAFILTIILINYDGIFNNHTSSTQKQTEDSQQNEKSIFRPGYDYFLGIWTQVADENGKAIPASKIPIKIRITKPDGFFYFVEVSFDNETQYLSMPGDGIYEKFGFTLRNRKLSHTTLEYKHNSHNPDSDYLYEEGGSGFFKKLEN